MYLQHTWDHPGTSSLLSFGRDSTTREVVEPLYIKKNGPTRASEPSISLHTSEISSLEEVFFRF